MDLEEMTGTPEPHFAYHCLGTMCLNTHFSWGSCPWSSVFGRNDDDDSDSTPVYTTKDKRQQTLAILDREI
jgi:hypothetical protein